MSEPLEIEKGKKQIDPVPTPHKQVDKMWGGHGVDDVFFQREAQLTWWTVLGGIAVGAILTEFDTIPVAIAEGKWYCLFYCLATLLVIVNSWVQTAWGSLVLRWPLSIPTSVSLFFQGIAMSVAGLNITRPSIWYASLSVVLATAIINQLIFSKTHAWSFLLESMIKRAKLGVRIYCYLLAFTVSVFIVLLVWPLFLLELIFGILAVGFSIFALFWQHIGMLKEKQELNIP